MEKYWSTALADDEPGFVERKLLPVADRYPIVWRILGTHVVYRNTGGSIIALVPSASRVMVRTMMSPASISLSGIGFQDC